MSYKTYEPVRYITIEGKVLPKDISDDVLNFIYDDVADKMDELRITVLDRELKHIDDPMLQEGKEIKVRWGYVDDLSETRTCTIKEIECDFPEGGDPTITIVAFDQGHKLTGRASRKSWTNTNVATVVKDIAAKHNMKPVIDIPGDIQREFFSQGGKNDMEYLRQLAAEVGCELKIKNSELIFAPDEMGKAPTVRFAYRSEQDGYLKSIKIRSDSEAEKGASKETEAPGVDPVKGEPFTPKGSAADAKYLVDLKDGGDRKETPPDAGHDETGRVAVTTSADSAAATDAAKSRATNAAKGAISADIVTIGLPYLAATTAIVLEGVGRKYSGSWKVEGVRHVIDDSGYICEIEAVKSDITKKPDSKKAGAATGAGQNTPGATSASAKSNTVFVDLKKEGE